MIYNFAGHCLDPERRELRRGNEVIPVEPQVFDLLHYLVQHRDRVVSKEQLYAAIWTEKVVSESTLSSRIAAVRRAIGDTGDGQRLVRTFSRKGFRFVGEVREQAGARQQTPAVAAPSVHATATAERRQMTILNCRIVELPSRLSLDPEDLSADIAAAWHAVAAIVEQSGGHVAHRSAENLLAYFGFPGVHEHDAERAVRAALAIVDMTSSLRLKVLPEPLRVAVGVATGLVVVESSAADGAPQVIGETPFTAARIVAMCDPGAVMISGATRALLGSLFEYRRFEARDGGAGHEGAFVVLGAGATANRFQALRAGGAPRVGRDEELGLLLRRWQQAGSGEGRVVLLSGEAGIGKSHLVAALQDAIRSEDHGAVHYYCSPHGMQSALQPVITQLEDLCGFQRGDADLVRLGKIERLVGAAFDGAPDSVALLADLLSIPALDRHAALALSAQRRKELLLDLLAKQVERLAARQRVLVVVEDAHWIDPTTAEFLDVLVDRLQRLPVLLVVTHRPDYEAPWLGQPHVTALLLNRLGPRESGVLVQQVAEGREVAPALVQQIVSQTDGIPLFVEEVTKAVLEARAANGGVAQAGGTARGLPMPATVRASVAARLERLAGARTLMQTCSALGREFSFALVRSVTALPDSELVPMLLQLVMSGLLRQRGVAPDAVYAFKHALVQDAAYETMVRKQREQVHRRIAEVCEKDFADLQAQHPEVFAHHCTEAGEWEKAIDARIRAARTARDRSAGIEAQAQVEAALSLLPRIADDSVRRRLEGRLEVARADALVMTRGFASPDVMTALSRARALLDAASDPLESIAALCGVFNFHLIRSESPACLALAKLYLGKPLDQPDATLIHYMAGTAELHIGDFADSVRHLETALSSYDEEVSRPIAFIPGYHLRSFVLIWLGLGYLYLGLLERAQRTITDAVADARSRSHPFTLVSALLAQARYRQHTLDFAGAIEATEEGMAVATEQRSPYHVSRASILRALNVCDAGRPQEGIELLERALVAHRATGANFQSSYNLSRLAQAHAQVGRFDRAAELADQAISEVERTGERWWQAEAVRIKGEILMAVSAANRAKAERCFEAALACARAQGARLWELQAAQSLAGLRSDSGRGAQAADLLARVYGGFSEGLDTPVLIAAKRTLQGIAR
ncbi:MAG TPA: AAA family ATPase [Burkholderiaceae bacterium]|nr:AAA family ATPase [Burkholderiaceae bacterium]